MEGVSRPRAYRLASRSVITWGWVGGGGGGLGVGVRDGSGGRCGGWGSVSFL